MAERGEDIVPHAVQEAFDVFDERRRLASEVHDLAWAVCFQAGVVMHARGREVRLVLPQATADKISESSHRTEPRTSSFHFDQARYQRNICRYPQNMDAFADMQATANKMS